MLGSIVGNLDNWSGIERLHGLGIVFKVLYKHLIWIYIVIPVSMCKVLQCKFLRFLQLQPSPFCWHSCV